MVGSVLSYFRRSWKFLVVTAGATIALSAIAVVVSLSGINPHRFEVVFFFPAYACGVMYVAWTRYPPVTWVRLAAVSFFGALNGLVVFLYIRFGWQVNPVHLFEWIGGAQVGLIVAGLALAYKIAPPPRRHYGQEHERY